jgi:hypothetical protein
MLLEEREDLGEQKIRFTITVKGLQDLLGSIEFNENENEFYEMDFQTWLRLNGCPHGTGSGRPRGPACL